MAKATKRSPAKVDASRSQSRASRLNLLIQAKERSLAQRLDRSTKPLRLLGSFTTSRWMPCSAAFQSYYLRLRSGIGMSQGQRL
jgi:hypothetical protein